MSSRFWLQNDSLSMDPSIRLPEANSIEWVSRPRYEKIARRDGENKRARNKQGTESTVGG